MNLKVLSWGSIFLCTSMLVGCGTSSSAPSPSSGAAKSAVPTGQTAAPASSKPFQGKTLKVVMATHNWTTAIQKLLPAFEAETGMKIEFESLAGNQLTQKLSVQFASGSSTPDLFMYRPDLEGRDFFKKGWIQAVDDYAQKDSDYQFSDFMKSSLGAVTVNGKLSGIPIITEQEVLYYRKDLLDKAKLPVPKTLDELLAAAKQLHSPNDGVYGFVGRGDQPTLITQFSSYLFSEGGDFTQNGKAALNSDAALKAYSTYGQLLGKYGPPGALNMGWPQASGIFAQGKAAFFTDASSVVNTIIDPKNSTVADKVGYASFPAGAAGAKPYSMTAWALAINAKSANKDAAWAFIRWATSKQTVLETQKLGNPGARTSVWNETAGTSGFPQDLVPVIKTSMDIGVDHGFPRVPNVSRATELVGSIVNKAMLGEDIKEAANKANTEIQQMIDQGK